MSKEDKSSRDVNASNAEDETNVAKLMERVKSLESKIDSQDIKLNKLISKVDDLSHEQVMKLHVLGNANKFNAHGMR